MFGFIVKLFVLVRKVRDVWEWLSCMHVDTSEGGAVMSRCGFRSVRYLEVIIRCKNALGPRIVSAVRSLEVVASRRLPLRAIKDWVQQFRCCIGAKFRSTFHIIDMYLELLNHSGR